MTSITVLDSIMGSGKTTYVINMINAQHTKNVAESFANHEHKHDKFLVVVPLLSEVDRLTHACPDLRFMNPQPVHGRKLYHLEKLVEDGENIVTTHALFRMLNRNVHEKLKQQNYTLIIDEVLDCVEMFDGLTKKDRKLLFDTGMVYVDNKTRRLCWNYESHPNYEGKFSDIKKLCDTGSIVCIKDQMLLWEFPSEFLTCFEKVIVCTYLFKGSPFYAYLQAEGFTIHMQTIRDGSLCEWDEGRGDKEAKAHLRSLISIYVGEGDSVADRLRMHAKDPRKEFWEHVCVVTSKDQNLTKAHVRYLESRIVELVREGDRANLANGNEPSSKLLPKSDVADMEYFLSQMQIILPVVGFDFLRPKAVLSKGDVAQSSLPRTSALELVLVSKKHNIEARAVEQDGEVTVLRGSTAVAKSEFVSNTYQALRDSLISEGRLRPTPDPSVLEFSSDVQFPSPSAAAAVIFNRNSNGRTAWKIASTGQTLKDYQDAQLVETGSEHELVSTAEPVEE